MRGQRRAAPNFFSGGTKLLSELTFLQALISYSLRFSAGINTRFLRRLTAFNSLRELTLISSTPLREPMPYSFRSPVPGSTSDSPAPQPTVWALLLQEQASIWAYAPYGNLKSKSLFAVETRSRDQLCSVILDSTFRD